MKILIIGATGRTGVHAVEAALERGMDVTVLVRTPSKLGALAERVGVVEGSAMDAGVVSRAVEGQDAVVSVMGHVSGSPANLLEESAKHVLSAMREHGIARLVTLLGAGVQVPGDRKTLGRRFMLGMMAVFAGKMIRDAQTHGDLVRAADDLEWTIVRPPRLTDEARTGFIKDAGTMDLGPSASMTRADLAVFMLDEVRAGRYVRQAPMVANG